MLESTEVALILAAVDDDAPWLVYCDQLQETGSEAQAAVLRLVIPAARLELKQCRPFPRILRSVVSLAAEGYAGGAVILCGDEPKAYRPTGYRGSVPLAEEVPD